MKVIRIRHPAAGHSGTTKKERWASKRDKIAAESLSRDFFWDAHIFGLFRMSIDSEPN
jgi:hypothetical protein